MTKLHTGLGIALAVQLLIAALLFFSQQPPQGQNLGQALLSFQPDQLDRVIVNDAEHSVTLSKTENGWIVPNLQKLPADAGKLDSLLNTLHNLQSGWPVATTSGSHERFEVAEGKFQRRLQLYRSDTLAGELYIGTSPGFRKSHVRKPGDDAVYVVKLNSFDWPVKQEEWLDKSLLAATDIDHIQGPDYVLQKKEDGWHFDAKKMQLKESADSTPPLDQEKAQQLAAALRSLRIQAPAETSVDLDSSDSKSITLQVTGPEGDWQYRFLQANDKYYVKRSDRKTVFSLAKFDYDRIVDVGLSTLKLKGEKEAENSKDVTEPPQKQPISK